jgi:hypothetical protein
MRTFSIGTGKGIALVGIAVLIAALMTGSALYHFATKTPAVIKVTGKEAIAGTSETSGKYLIYTETEVLENSDSIWALKWNSSDVYRKIERGRCYRTSIWGYRIPFLSVYRQIDQVKEVPCS